jgi:membrane-bound serine protease (ClpP class)
VQLHVQKPDAGYTVQMADQTAVIGLTGVALSMLRPAGKGRFGDATYQVVSRGEFIPPGTPVVIVQVDGNRYVVDRVEEKR